MENQEKEIIDIEISSLANNGLGLGHVNFGKNRDKKMVVFVENALPGELVTAEIIKKKPNFWTGRSVAIKTAAPERVIPRCQNFPRDGDCVLQHLSYPGQLFWKQKWVAETLRRFGHLENLKIEEIIPGPDIWHYRNKLELSFFEAAGRSVLGFNEKGKFNSYILATEVTIGPAGNGEIIRAVNQYFSDQPASVFRPKEKTGFLKNLVLQKSASGLNLTLVTGPGDLDFSGFSENISRVLNLDPKNNGILWQKENQPAGNWGREYFVEQIGKFIFQIPPSGFFQVNPAAFEKLLNRLLVEPTFEKLTGKKPFLFEFYAGVGTIGIILNQYFREIINVESSGGLTDFAHKNAQINKVKNIQFFNQATEQFIKNPETEKLPAEKSVVLVDPPRDGLHPRVTDWLLKNLPAGLIYFSCNPATLGRDLNHLKGNFRCCFIQPADLFPQVAHVEVLVILERVN